MKLMRIGPKGAEKPALLDASGKVRDLSGVLDDITPPRCRRRAWRELRSVDPAALPVVERPGRIAPPWRGCAKFVCVGLNYADHAAETGAPIPAEPILFMKATSALVGCNDPSCCRKAR